MTGEERGPSNAEDATLLSFLRLCADRLTARAETPAEATGAATLSRAIASSVPLCFEPSWLSALDTLGGRVVERLLHLDQRELADVAGQPNGPTDAGGTSPPTADM